MKIFRISYLLFMPLLLCLACEKEAPQLETKVSGKVVTNNTNDFPGDTALPIELVEMTGGSGLGVGEKVRQTKYTDENGHFSFTFTADDYQDAWFVRVPHTHTPPLHYDMSTAGGVPVKVGEVQDINIELRSMAWLKLHVKNINPQPGDIIRISLGAGEVLQYFGNADEVYISKISGNTTEMSFPYAIERNGATNLYRDTVGEIPAFDTTYHLLEY